MTLKTQGKVQNWAGSSHQGRWGRQMGAQATGESCLISSESNWLRQNSRKFRTKGGSTPFFQEKTSLLLNKKQAKFEDFPRIWGKLDSLIFEHKFVKSEIPINYFFLLRHCGRVVFLIRMICTLHCEICHDFYSWICILSIECFPRSDVIIWIK